VTILDLNTIESNGVVHLELRGELDLSTATRVEEELRRVEAERPPVVALDLRQLSFLDSTGLRLVLSADARAREEGWRLVVVRGPEQVNRVFAITRLEDRIEMVDDASDLAGAP
jgi:anti-anti-sigma factor